MRAGLLFIAALVIVFAPTASAEESVAEPSCVTTWDPSGGVYLPRVDAGYCISTAFEIVNKVVGKPDAA